MPVPVEPACPSLTWLVGFGPHHQRAICVEAAAPARVEAFKRYHNQCFNIVVQPPDTSWNGQPLMQDQKRQLHMGIKRQQQAVHKGPRKGRAQQPETPAFAVNEILRRVAMLHEIETPDLLLKPAPRKERALTRARKHVIFLLTKELGLSQPHIASLLGYKDHTTVRHVLSQSLDQILR